MMITKKSIHRRTVLRGVGATLALPLLDAMVPALSAMRETAAAPVPRFGAFYVPNGMSMHLGHWTPKGEGPLNLSFILEPLTPFCDKTVVVSGLTNKPADPQPDEGAGDHTRGPGSYLTAAHLKKTEGADIRAGISMDMLAAREIGKETQIDALQLGLERLAMLGNCDNGYTCAYRTISWGGPAMPLAPENQPRAIFERMFGDSGTTERSVRIRQISQRHSLLDTMMEDVERLKHKIGPGDQRKLGEYLSAVRDVERRIELAEQQVGRDLPLVESPATGVPGEIEPHFRLLADLIVLAYQSDLTRVFSFLVGEENSGRTYPQVGVPEGHHSLSHHMYIPYNLENLAKVNRYHVQLFTYLLDRLQATPDGDGSLLDHALISYGAGISNSDRHSHDDLPVFLVGGAGGRLKGGRHVKVAKDTPFANLHVNVLHKLGVPVDGFGDDSTGDLSEV